MPLYLIVLLGSSRQLLSPALALGTTLSLLASCTRCSPQQRAGSATEIPTGPDQNGCVQEAASGGETICVLRHSGTVQCFGHKGNETPREGTAVTGPPMANITGDHRAICGIDRFEGRVWCWGDGSYQAVQVPELGTDNRQVSFTNSGYCVVRNNGQLFCHTDVNIYRRLEGTILEDVHLTAQTCAIKNRTVLCWGTNQDGVVGLPSTGSDTLHPPTPIRGLPGEVTHLARTSGAACALNKAGEVWCWGNNDDGQLGVADFVFCPEVSGMPPPCERTFSAPRQAALPEPATDLVQALPFCALGVSGGVWCWGNNMFGSVRYPKGTARVLNATGFTLEPIPVLNEGFGSDNVRLFGGSGNICALKRNGSLWCNGDNRYSQVARPTVERGYRSHLPPHRMPVTCP